MPPTSAVRSCALDGWNREHTWAQSRGSFNTSAGPGTDLFHMRPLRGNTNSSRGNKDFDNGGTNNVPGCPICKSDGDSFEPRDSFKGDLARGLFYMDVRFNGDADDGYGLDLRMWDTVGNSGSQIGKLSTLVAWSLADPPDAGERTRNDLVDDLYQHNRNPFIDHPEWVCSIYSSQVPAALCARHQPGTDDGADDEDDRRGQRADDRRAERQRCRRRPAHLVAVDARRCARHGFHRRLHAHLHARCELLRQ